jgi:hypothetical protein
MNNFMMGYGFSGVMGGFGFLGIITWLIVIVDLALVGMWLWKQVRK